MPHGREHRVPDGVAQTGCRVPIGKKDRDFLIPNERELIIKGLS